MINKNEFDSKKMAIGTVAMTPPEEEDRTIVISSPGGGIGKVLTYHLLKQGYNIIGMGSAQSGLYAEFLASQGHSVDFIEIDYGNETSITEAFEAAKSVTQKIAGFIHLTGGSIYNKTIDTLKFQEFQKVVTINLNSSFLLGQEAFKWMKETGGGNIIFFGSTTGIEPTKKKMPYAVTKAAVHTMTKAFALEGSAHGIITNAIAPGYVLTERHVDELKQKANAQNITYDEMLEAVREKNPLKGLLTTEDLLPTIDLLLQTSKIQGQIITLDLGQTGM